MSITLKDIYRDFGDFTLHVDLEVRKGELVSLLGPSGCGKSTTLRIIAGFEQSDRGSVFLNERDISPVPAEKRNIGMVFQDYALFPHMTVFDNIAYGPKLRKWDRKKISESVNRFLEIVHLEGFGNRRIEHLSGGEQQRVALARALVTEPQLLLLDEPLSALDAKLRKTLRREIRSIQRDLGITTLYVTHDQEEALTISDRIAVMKEGRCLQYDTPRELYRRPSHIFSAGFIGNSNLIEVSAVSPENMTGETELGTFHVDFINGPKYSHLFFRPDKCLVVNEEPSVNSFMGIISDIEYTGSMKNLEIDSRGKIIHVSVPENSSLGIGEKVQLYVPPEHCRIL